MIKGSRHTESAVDPGIIFCRYVWHSACLQKGEQLITPDIEKHVPNTSAFFDLDRVSDDGRKAQHAFVKLASLVKVKGGKADMGKYSLLHGYLLLPCKFLTIVE